MTRAQLNPLNAGVGLRTPHFNEVLTTKPDVGFLEVHSENFFAEGGAVKRVLDKASELYPLSFHGVSLSLGSVKRPCEAHLKRLKQLVDVYNPALVSEHVAWNMTETAYLNDLLPLPYTKEALDVLCRNIDIVQNTLGRKILIENPSAYLKYDVPHMMPEGAFITEAVKRTGCGLLLDVNNVYVSCMNMGEDATAHLSSMPLGAVGEIHLAGHTVRREDKGTIRIDTHNDVVCDDVWALYKEAISRTGAVPTLIEWDLDIPPLETLLTEAQKANAFLKEVTTHAK